MLPSADQPRRAKPVKRAPAKKNELQAAVKAVTKTARVIEKAQPKPIVKPPRGDVASSGGDYGMKRANQYKASRAHSKALVKTALEQAARQPRLTKVKGGSPLAAATAVADAGVKLASDVAPVVSAVALPAVTAPAAIVQKATGKKTLDTVSKIARNVPKDAAELAVTTPSGVAKLATTAVHHPGKVPGMLAAPYKQLAEHPGKFITEHPVSAALMVAPGVRMPGRVAGKVARVAGKQTLERPVKTFPGTALKETQTGSRDAVVRAVQSRRDKQNPKPTMSPKEVQRRVDEHVAREQIEAGRVRTAVAKSAAREVKDRKGMSRQDKQAFVQDRVEGALAQNKTKAQRRFAQEFGATATRTPEGALIKPKNATSGALHTSRVDAEAVAKKAPFDAIVKEVGDKQFAVIPKVAQDRIAFHNSVGSTKATGAKVMRTGRRLFSGTVLPVSPKWLAGQGIEGGLRSVIAGAGPTSYIRAVKVAKEMDRQVPGSGTALLQRAAGSGHFGLAGPARDFLHGRSLADEFNDGIFAKPARGVTNLAKKPGISHVRSGWHHYTDFVFNAVNGALETTAQKAMLGKAIKNSPLMERHVIGLSDKAIKDAAAGLHGTESQVALGRTVDRMYGKYAKFNPEQRSLILHWSPFIPWYLNVATFLTRVLPVDHPVTTALVADTQAATEEWRKAHGLSLRGGKARPGFLLGGYPVGKGDQILRIAHYTPFGVGPDVTESVANLVLPQFGPTIAARFGVDWTGKPLKYPGFKGRPFNQGEKALYSAVEQAAALVPGVGVAGNVTGVIPKYVEHKDQATIFNGKDIGEALRRQFDPFKATAANPKPPTAKKAPGRKAVKLGLGARGGKLPLGGSGKKLPLR